MGERSHHSFGRLAREFSIGIKRDYETNSGQCREVANFDGEAIKLLAHQVVEVHQFAALTLPTHPEPLARIVDAMAMEQEERSHFFIGIFLVEAVDEIGSEVDESVVFNRLEG